MKITVRGNEVTLTGCTILATRNHFADIYQGCIDEVLSGDVKVNDNEVYFVSCKRRMIDSLTGKSEKNFTFIQRAYWLQSGECIPLL